MSTQTGRLHKRRRPRERRLTNDSTESTETTPCQARLVSERVPFQAFERDFRHPVGFAMSCIHVWILGLSLTVGSTFGNPRHDAGGALNGQHLKIVFYEVHSRVSFVSQPSLNVSCSISNRSVEIFIRLDNSFPRLTRTDTIWISIFCVVLFPRFPCDSIERHFIESSNSD